MRPKARFKWAYRWNFWTIQSFFNTHTSSLILNFPALTSQNICPTRVFFWTLVITQRSKERWIITAPSTKRKHLLLQSMSIIKRVGFFHFISCFHQGVWLLCVFMAAVTKDLFFQNKACISHQSVWNFLRYSFQTVQLLIMKSQMHFFWGWWVDQIKKRHFAILII